jgi:hypothetical protein
MMLAKTGGQAGVPLSDVREDMMQQNQAQVPWVARPNGSGMGIQRCDVACVSGLGTGDDTGQEGIVAMSGTVKQSIACIRRKKEQ